MADELEQLEDWIGGLIQQMQPAERRKLARAVSLDLRRDNVDRIGAQKNPDGSSYTPRKRAPLRSKSGRMKRRADAMFQKLRKPAYLTAAHDESEASIGFPNATVSRVARVHQDGLRDRVARTADAPIVAYPKRVLVGFSPGYRERLADLVLAHLNPG
ncbi:phage virion morphogenesis protein [Brevundimonas sp. UBA7664]|uniref:phage virion morphogenesis protein n=1 Tax=Brevundimonas sp. UBA7664 TaxID=1946141 RepID=UPI0025B9A6C4|nr:phage virion morphogenesis protein [Brevundimonas sp. UBA7664]